VSNVETQPRVDDTRHEGYATGWLTVGLILGPVGAVIGVYLVLRSTRWTLRWKAGVLALPAALVVLARTLPRSLPGLAVVLILVVTIGLVWRVVHVLEEAAQRGSGHRRASRAGALVIAVLAVGIASVLAGRLHPIGSYDYHDDVVTAAHDADVAGEPYGVVTQSFDNGSDENTVATIQRLAGPGNARFVAIFDELESKAGGFETSKLSTKQLGTCYVFPVVKSRREGIESVTALSRRCTGPSEAGSTVRLSDR
jgi:hypothetical protein